MNYTIEKVTTLIGARRYGDKDANISFVLTDSRSLCFPEETLFFALKTERNDGQNYIPELYARGVRNFVVEVVPEDWATRYPDSNFLKVVGSLEALQRLAERHRDEYLIPIVGITGSNGKTTTTTMIAQVLTAGGQNGLLSGNIGFPASQVAQTASSKDMLVMELSSFQLMGIEDFHPQIAVITNLMPTHLDYHGSVEEYAAAKWNIQKNMTADDYLVLNFNQDWAKEMASQTQATVMPFSTTEKVDGAYLEGDVLTFRGEAIMQVAEIGVPGSHNVENALATIAVAKLRGIDNQTIKEVLSAFGGVKHRLQYVGQVNEVAFYNDSKSTNILATQKALSGFDNSKVILIAGGLDRGNEFDELVPDLKGLKKMVILGQSAARVKRAADQAGVSYLDATDVRDAAHKAFAQAEPGDIVLLSPANASWDMYSNFEVRGDEFLAAFEELKG